VLDPIYYDDLRVAVWLAGVVYEPRGAAYECRVHDCRVIDAEHVAAYGATLVPVFTLVGEGRADELPRVLYDYLSGGYRPRVARVQSPSVDAGASDLMTERSAFHGAIAGGKGRLNRGGG